MSAFTANELKKLADTFFCIARDLDAAALTVKNDATLHFVILGSVLDNDMKTRAAMRALAKEMGRD